MDEHTRYRVTGSLFLLAIAVILFPMLFDGAGLPPVEIEPLSVPAEKPSVTRRMDVAPQTNVVERAAELVAEIDDTGFLTEDGTRIGEPLLTEADSSTRVWAVQLGSFVEAENARKLRDRLRGYGYEAFISTVKKDAVVMSRVAVGPLLSRADADNLRDELSGSLSLNARIVAFSN